MQVVTNDNGQSVSGGAGGRSTDPMEQINILRDELSRLRDESRADRVHSSAPTHSFVYIPRERQVQSFSGKYEKDGKTVKEFIEEVKSVLRTRGQSREGHCDYILSLLCGPALEEMQLCMGDQSVETGELYFYLRNAFGEKCSVPKFLQAFYNCKQADGEDLRDYSHALSQLLKYVMTQSSDAVLNEKVVQRDQFIEGLGDAALRRELCRMVRDWPEFSILDVQDEALLWQVKETRTYTRVARRRQVQSDDSEALCSGVTTEWEQHTILDQVQRAVARQDKQITEITKTQSELSGALKDLTTGSTCRTVPEPRQRARPQPRFTPDGKPICFKCNGEGHVARTCLRSQRV